MISAVIRRLPGPLQPPHLLPALYERLGELMVIEFKGPTDDDVADSLLDLEAYGLQFVQVHPWQTERSRKRLERARVHLVLLVDHLTRGMRACADEYGLAPAEESKGAWRVDGARFPMYILEMRELCDREREHLWYLFTKAYVHDPASAAKRMAHDERKAFTQVHSEVIRVHQEKGPMAYRDSEVFTEKDRELQRAFLAQVPIKDRLEGITLEDRLAGLAPAEVAQAL